MNKLFTFILVLFFAILCSLHEASAQQVSIGTNTIDWINHGTTNLNVNVSIGAHMTVGLSGRYNPWFFNKNTDDQVNHALRGASLDFRYWPWHVYSGWWFMAKGQFLEFNYGNLYGADFSEQGYSYGAAIGAGYALMLGEHWNVDFGLSLWGGVKDYSRYDCAHCGRPIEEGKKGFLLPDNVFVSFYYIF